MQRIVSQRGSWQNKTQRQLCKRLAEPFISFSWSCLVWKRVSLWMWSLGGRQQPFSCVLGNFRHGDKQPTKQPNNQVILVQACSWPVRRQSFAIKLRTPFSVTYLHNMLSGQCPDVLDGWTWLMPKVARGEWCEYLVRKCQQQHICTKYRWHQK